uniref:Uncharacterized protein n=1 Tax=Melopsittacus undulatus TaxID=13146 RepID=A0A8V5H2Y5_MELUD
VCCNQRVNRRMGWSLPRWPLQWDTFCPVWPGSYGRIPSWPDERCPGLRSPQNPAPAAAWSASPPAAGRIYPSFSLQTHPPPPPAAQPPP